MANLKREYIDGEGWKTVVDAGGGSQPITREQLTGAATTITNGGDASLEWGNKTAGDDLLDVTDPFAPVVLAAGVYAFSAQVSVDQLTPGGNFRASVTVNGDVSGNGIAEGLFSLAGNCAQLSLTCYCAEDAPIAVRVVNNDGVTSRDFSVVIFVQRIS
jgi:hypothetical protein